MPPLAHHAGEQALAQVVVLLAGGGLSLIMAIGRARLAAACARLAGKRRSGRRA
jgi:hypothetical protein